jgi:hypothetical protein
MSPCERDHDGDQSSTERQAKDDHQRQDGHLPQSALGIPKVSDQLGHGGCDLLAMPAAASHPPVFGPALSLVEGLSNNPVAYCIVAVRWTTPRLFARIPAVVSRRTRSQGILISLCPLIAQRIHRWRQGTGGAAGRLHPLTGQSLERVLMSL